MLCFLNISRRQFPTDGTVQNNIDSALSLLVDNPNAVSYNNLQTILPVKQAQIDYNNAQQDIATAAKVSE